MTLKRTILLLVLALTFALMASALSEGDQWTCPNCGRADNTLNFCPSCGEPRPAINWTCPVCGREDNEDNFCPSCGEPRPEAQVAAPQSTVTPAPISDEEALSKGIAAFDDRDWETAMEYLKPLADGGDAEAQWRVGKMFHYGQGVDENDELAATYFQFSAEQNSAWGQYWYASALDRGWGVEKDPSRAMELFLLSAGQGIYASLEDIALMYQEGDGVPQDYDKAAYYLGSLLKHGGEYTPGIFQRAVQDAAEEIRNRDDITSPEDVVSNPTPAPTPTAAPTATATPVPTAAPTATPEPADPGWDIPSVIENISVPIVVGQKGSQKATDWCTAYEISSYDYYGSDTKAEWAKPYIDAITEQGPFEQVDYLYHDLLSVGTELESYYFRYTGDKQLSDFDAEWDLSYTPKQNDLQIDVSHYHSRDHVCVSVRWPKELVFADKDLIEGTWYHGEDDPDPNPDPNPDPAPGTTPYKPKQPCPKCHGNREVECSQCNGQGGKNIYDHSTKSTGYTWENCFKCKGKGKVACTYCGGDGYIND